MKFSEIDLHPSVYAGVVANHYIDCTPIQEASIMPILAGHDIAGLAQTGTGKTAAFVLPLLDRIVRSREAAANGGAVAPASAAVGAGSPATEVNASSESAELKEASAESKAPLSPEELEKLANELEKEEDPRPIFANWRKPNFILILVPTRELAEQVCENVTRLAKDTGLRAAAIYGGTGYEPQKEALKEAVEFVVATPGRLIDLFKENFVDLSQVRAIVFDEADRMFDMGFKDDMKFILRRVPKERQFLVYSATLNFDVLNTAYEFGANPIEINVSRDQTKAENVDDEIFHVGHFEKAKFLLSILKKEKPKQAIVFSNFKRNVSALAKFLSKNEMPALGISSMISQSQRLRIMELFKAENDSNILVATDVAARGLDIKGVDLVINFELPDDAENYVHRIGRTGRAGAKGRALSLVSDRDVEALSRIETYLGHKVTIGWIDDSEMVKEFKPFVPDSDRFERNDRGGSGGGGRGGFDRGGRSGGGPRRHGGGDRDRGGRGGFDRDRGGRSGERDHGSRYEHRRPDQAARPDQTSDQSGQRDLGNRDQRPQQRHQGRPHQGPRHGGGRPHHQQRGDGRPQQGQRDHGNRDQRPQQGGPRHQANGQRPQGGRPQHNNKQGARPQGRHTFRPGQQKAQAGVVAKVTGFFKGLFGSSKKPLEAPKTDKKQNNQK